MNWRNCIVGHEQGALVPRAPTRLVESHKELAVLILGKGVSAGHEAARTVGGVGAAVLVGGSVASLAREAS